MKEKKVCFLFLFIQLIIKIKVLVDLLESECEYVESLRVLDEIFVTRLTQIAVSYCLNRVCYVLYYLLICLLVLAIRLFLLKAIKITK